MDPGNTFAMITTMAFLLVLPIALYLEGPILKVQRCQNHLLVRQFHG